VIVILSYLTFNIGYLIVFALAGIFRKYPSYERTHSQRRFAIFIPTYKEDSIVIDAVKKNLKQHYPKHLFDIILIADHLQEFTITKLASFPIIILIAVFKKSTKAKSIKFALQQLPDNYYDVALILDADNIMEDNALNKINWAFEMGFVMVQAHRTAKNLNTSTAILDAISEEINNHIFRTGHRALGLSSALIGSGMAFDYSIFKDIIVNSDIENNPGEDREINLRMLQLGHSCEYLDDCYVYDEKVQTNTIMEQQRTRWISAQFQYAVKFWWKDPLQTIFSGVSYFDLAVQTLLLPRAILLVLTLILTTVALGFELASNRQHFTVTMYCLGLFLCCLLSFALGLYGKLPLNKVLSSIAGIPTSLYHLFRAFLKSKSNQKEFIHTPKDYIAK